jgi:hypothetical protein
MNPQTLKDAVATLMTKFGDAVANPKPNYSIDGQSVSYSDYLKMLQEAMKAALELVQMVEPFELRSTIL